MKSPTLTILVVVISAAVCLAALLAARRDRGYISGVSPYRYDVRVFQDPGNGCQYLIAEQSITPRLDPSGKPLCRDNPAAASIKPR